MKTMSIYWNNDSDELRLLPPDVRTMTCGSDGMQVIGSDKAIDALAACVAENPQHFSVADETREARDYELTNALHVANDECGYKFGSVTELVEWLES